MKYFKLGLAAIASVMTAVCVIIKLADGFLAIGGKLGWGLEFSLGLIIALFALPGWLWLITKIQKTQPYLRFKNWCIYQYHDILRAD